MARPLVQYVGAASDATLHILPNGGMCFYSGEQKGASAIAEVNASAAALLTQADGRDEIATIAERVAEQYPLDATTSSQVSAFLSAAVDRGILTLEPAKKSRPIRTTGSVEFYAPVHVMFELTRDCNLRCGHCYNRSGLVRHPRIPTSVLLGLIRSFGELGGQAAELTGGEPLVHPAFDEIFDVTCASFRRVAVLSNGWFFTANRARRIAPQRRRIVVQIDLDGATPDVHDGLRGVRGAFVRAQAAVRNLADQDITVRVAMTVTDRSVEQVGDVIALAYRLGAKRFALSPVLALGRGRSIQDPIPDQRWRKASEAIAEANVRYPGFLATRDEEREREWAEIGNCGAGYRSCVVDPNGEVRPCPLMADLRMSMGNVVQSGFKAVFGGPVPSILRALRAPGRATCDSCSLGDNQCDGCILSGIMGFDQLGSQCSWGVKNRVSEWLQISMEGSITAGCPAVGRHEFVFAGRNAD